MALTIDWREVKPVRFTEDPDSGPAAQAVDPGTYVSLNADGKFELGGSGGGVSLSRAITANNNISILKQGELELGAGLQGVPFDAPIFADSLGTITDEDTTAAGGFRIGTVVAGYGEGATGPNQSRKLLRLHI